MCEVELTMESCFREKAAHQCPALAFRSGERATSVMCRNAIQCTVEPPGNSGEAAEIASVNSRIKLVCESIACFPKAIVQNVLS